MREFINDFPAKTEMNDNLTGVKKSNSFIARTKKLFRKH